MSWAEHLAHMGEKRNAYRVWCEGQKERDHKEGIHIGGKKIIKVDIREIGWDGMDWIDLAQDRDQCNAFVNTKCLEILEFLSDW
jgi:hypothetical protein